MNKLHSGVHYHDWDKGNVSSFTEVLEYKSGNDMTIRTTSYNRQGVKTRVHISRITPDKNIIVEIQYMRRETWKKLRKGMEIFDVTDLIGYRLSEEKKHDKLFWYYSEKKDCSYLLFDDKKGLAEWVLPE